MRGRHNGAVSTHTLPFYPNCTCLTSTPSPFYLNCTCLASTPSSFYTNCTCLSSTPFPFYPNCTCLSSTPSSFLLPTCQLCESLVSLQTSCIL